MGEKEEFEEIFTPEKMEREYLVRIEIEWEEEDGRIASASFEEFTSKKSIKELLDIMEMKSDKVLYKRREADFSEEFGGIGFEKKDG